MGRRLTTYKALPFALACLLFLATTAAERSLAQTPRQRVVSLDFCADQFVLKLLPRENILALSPDSEQHFSYLRADAAGIAKVRPTAEDVLSLRPITIVRSYGGGPHAVHFFERAGVTVVQVPYANDLDGIRSAILSLAEKLGVAASGEALVAQMDARLHKLAATVVSTAPTKSALYMTPTGVTSGPGTMVHEMLTAAGLRNFQTLPGWRSLPLERLAYEQPDVIAAAFFDENIRHPGMWSAMRHPVAKQQIGERPNASIDGAWTACGGWFLLDAIESLAAVAATASPP